VTGTLFDVDAPNTAWRGGSEDPIPLLLGRWSRTAALYRFVTCRPLDGHARTDATFWHPGTRALTVSKRVMPYQYWAGWKRGLLITRVPPFLLAPWTAVSVAEDALNLTDVFHYQSPFWLSWEASAVGWAPLAGFAGWRGARYVRDYRHDRDYLRPVLNGAVAILKTRDGIKVDLPRPLVRGDEQATGTLGLPSNHPMAEGDRDNLIDMVRQRLSNPALDARFNMQGRHPHMEIFTPPQPPERVGWDVMFEKANTNSPHLGESATGAVRWDLGESSPHIGVVGGTGSGKSELVAWVVGQFMRGGAGVAVLDPKGTSHRWLMNVPEVLYCGTPAALTDAVMAIDAELSRRAAANKDAAADIDFPRLAVLVEERNSLQDVLRQHWKETAPSGRRGEQAPAIGALNRIGSMGRSLNITLVMAGQETAQQYIGTRSNYGAWAVAGRMAPNHWRTIMGAGGKKPPMGVQPGRFGYVVGGHAVAFQAAFPDVKHDPDTLTRWATSGERMWSAATLLQQYEETHNSRSEPVAADDDTHELVTLRDMVTDAVTIVMLRTWRNRYPDFPDAVETRGREQWFDRAEMAAWIAQRTGGDDA